MSIGILLFPFEGAYSVILGFWNWGYRRKVFPIYSVGVKVISIGNLTWGGTGKTPLVEYLAHGFKEKRGKVAVLSRGYGSPQDRLKADEVQWLTHMLEGIPIFSEPDRVASARQAQQQGIEVLILDDGFQHRRLARNFDIVTIDATDPFGNGRLIPAGKLREPVQSLKRADWIILTKTDLVNDEELSQVKEKIQKIIPDIPISETIYRPVCLRGVWFPRSAWEPQVHSHAERGNENHPSPLESDSLPEADSPQAKPLAETHPTGSFAQDDKMDISILKDQKVGLVAAIGNPEGFKRTVKKLGAQVVHTYFKRDHSYYSSADFKKMEEIQKKDSFFCWVTTSKDAVKIRGDERIRTVPIYELEIELIFKEGERKLWQAIKSL